MQEYWEAGYEVQRYETEDEGRSGEVYGRGGWRGVYGGTGGDAAVDAGVFCVLDGKGGDGEAMAGNAPLFVA